MSDRAVVTGVRVAAVTGASIALAGTLIDLATGRLGHWWTSHSGVATLITIGLCAVVWVVVPRQPRNASVWAMATAPLLGLTVLAGSIAPFLTDADLESLVYPHYVPADHPGSVAWLFGITEALSSIGVFIPLTLGLLLFPTGTVPGPRWRWVGWAAVATSTAVAVAYPIAFRPSATHSPESWPILGTAQFAVVGVMVLAIVAVLARLRSSVGETRQQIKWVLWGGAIAVLALAVGMALAGGNDWLSPLVVFSGATVLIATYGVAIARYRLYDVDLVISRTIVFGSLATVITGVYIGVVVGVSELIGTSDGPHTVVAIVATAGVAAAFQPLRQHLQRLADRLVYGKRATPHDVLSELTRRVAANDDRLLELVARSLVDGTGASRAEVLVNVDGRDVTAAEWPDSAGADRMDDPERFPIEHHGDGLGAVVLSVPAGQRLSESDRMLAVQVASGMGLALRNRSLTETLQRRIVELRESRRRLVAVQDGARRRLERDLHDGAQQQLVALRVKLGLARTMACADGAAATVAAVDRLTEEADGVVDAVRDFARGVYPPLLEAEGLGPAVAALGRASPVVVSVDAASTGRHEREAESTVYACIVEALQNVALHAAATEASVTIAHSDGTLAFEVRDDGVGFPAETITPGPGLSNMADRLDALAGTFSLRSAPGLGTTVAGSVPVGEVARA